MAGEPEAFLGACARHLTERAVNRCDDCGDVYCDACFVPPTRKRMPLRCVDCALVAAGVRAPGARRNTMVSLNRTSRRPTSRW